MLDSQAPNGESVHPDSVLGKRAVLPIREIRDGARAVVLPAQGVGNPLVGWSHPPIGDAPARASGADRPASPDFGHCRAATPRGGGWAVNPRLPRTSGEQGEHTNAEAWRNEYLYCADTSEIVSSVTIPHEIAGGDVEHGSTERPAPTDPTQYRGLVSDARGDTRSTRPDRAGVRLARAAAGERLPPTHGRPAVELGDGRIRPPERHSHRRRNDDPPDGVARPGRPLLESIQRGCG